MNKFKELLNRKVGPFAVWVWLVLLAVGAAIGMYLRAKSAEKGDGTPADPAGDIHGDPGFGVPYTGGYVGYPATTPATDYDWFRDIMEALAAGIGGGNRFDDPTYGGSQNPAPTALQSSFSSYDVGSYSYQLKGSSEVDYGNVREIDPALLDGATVFTPSGSFEVSKKQTGFEGQTVDYLAVYDNPLGGTKTDTYDFTRLTKPLANMLNTQDKNVERIRANPEWYTEEQRRAAGL